MRKKSSNSGNLALIAEERPRYKGFLIDMLEDIRKRSPKPIDYELYLSPDGHYGVETRYDNDTVVWNGMIGELVNEVSYIFSLVFPFDEPRGISYYKRSHKTIGTLVHWSQIRHVIAVNSRSSSFVEEKYLREENHLEERITCLQD